MTIRITLRSFKMSGLYNKRITTEEILTHQQKCLEQIDSAELYEIRNRAKLRAVYMSQNYDEFKDIVDAAHIKSITKEDKRNFGTKTRIWNSAAKSN